MDSRIASFKKAARSLFRRGGDSTSRTAASRHPLPEVFFLCDNCNKQIPVRATQGSFSFNSPPLLSLLFLGLFSSSSSLLVLSTF